MSIARGALTVFLLSVAAPVSARCPVCCPDTRTLADRVAQTDVVLVVRWLDGARSAMRVDTTAERKPGELRVRVHWVRPIEPRFEPARTAYEVVEILKGRDPTISVGGTIELDEYRDGTHGEFQLLLQHDIATPAYDSVKASEAAIDYARRAPARDGPPQTWLIYYLSHLEHVDPQVADDAHDGACRFQFQDLAPLADRIPRDLIHAYLAGAEPSSSRLGLYGMLLGLCGDENDVRMMQRLISEPTDDLRIGIEGVMSGYLLLTGEQGLDLIDSTRLASQHLLDSDGQPILDKDDKPLAVPLREVYAAMEAVRFMWQHGEDRISKDRLRQSMRTLLDRPELADLVIADLARWKDWSVQKKLMGLYGKKGYEIPSIKRAIVRYLLACTKDRPEDSTAEAPKHAAQAEQYLAELRKMDPKVVRDAERFYFPE